MILAPGRTCFALETNTFVVEMNELKMRVQTSAPHSYTCSYQRLSNRTTLEIGTHIQKRAVAQKWAVAMLSYLPASTLHPQVVYVIAFSAGPNGLQVDKLIEETMSKLLPTLLPACTAHAQ